jgi:hypothetical protein
MVDEAAAGDEDDGDCDCDEDDGVVVPPSRLVDARRAEDMLPVPAPPLAEEDAEEVLTGPLLPEPVERVGGAEAVCTLDRSRPMPDRLPRMMGSVREAEFSAAVEPVNRIVFSRIARETAVMRMVLAAAASELSTARCRQ